MGIARLDTMHLPNHQAVRWRSTFGVRPDSVVLEVHRRIAEPWWRAYAGGPVTLHLQEGETVREIKNLRVLRPLPSSHPDLMAFEVVDIRWALARAWVVGRYNVRRKSGDRRIVFKDILGNANVVDDIAYDPASLHPPFGQGSRPYTSDLVLYDVLDQLKAQMPAGWELNYQVEVLEQSVDPENIEIDDPGDAGLQAALNTSPGSSVKVTDEGVLVVASQTDRSEEIQRRAAGPAIRGPAVAMMADHRLVMPQYIDVLFTREVELRFDFFTSDQVTVAGSSIEPRELENVAPVPDQDIDGYPPGTWLTFDRLFEIWGVNPVTGAQLSHDVIRRQYMNPAFISAMAEFGEQRAEMDSDQARWTDRMGAVMTHYLLTFRIPRRWVDRVLRFNPYRLSILDTETGTRAPSQAWMDYAIIYGDRARRIAQQALLARNIDGWMEDLGDTVSRTTSPADVTVLSQDEGVLRVNLHLDPYGFGVKTVPCKLDNIPTAKIGDVARKPRFFSEVRGAQAAAPKLTDDHRMSMVLSAVPKYPAGLQQFHRVRVYPSDMVDFGELQLDLPVDPSGPPWTVRMPAGIETARFAWQDENEGAIEGAFGLTQWDPDSLNNALSHLLLNGDTLEGVAKTAAALLYAGFRNRPLGQHVEFLSDSAELAGAMRALTHTIARGQATTAHEYLTDLPARSLFDHLPRSVADVVRRTVK